MLVRGIISPLSNASFFSLTGLGGLLALSGITGEHMDRLNLLDVQKRIVGMTQRNREGPL